MKNHHLLKIALILIIASLLNACASSNAGDVYSRDEARKIQTIRKGVVETVRLVRLEGQKVLLVQLLAQQLVELPEARLVMGKALQLQPLLVQ